MKKFVLLLCVMLSFQAALAERIVVLSPDVADIVVALGAADEVVGKDVFNKNPALKDVPAVGLHRSVTPEAVLTVKPTLVIGSWMVQPPSIFERLSDLGVKAENVSAEENIDAYLAGISAIGKLIGKEHEAQQMVEKWNNEIASFPKTGTRYLLSYDGRFVAGKNTVSDTLIRLAGGVNVADFEGLKPMSREAWLEAKPDVIIIAEHHKDLVNVSGAFAERPEIKDSPAAKNQKILFWPANDYFRYGLNTPEVVRKLHDLSQKP